MYLSKLENVFVQIAKSICPWLHLQAKQVAPSGCQNYNHASSATWWPKLEPMLIALRVGQIWNQFWWHSLVVKFSTNTSGTTYNWPNLEPMQVAFYLAGEITQVIDSMPWVRCASGNVYIEDDIGDYIDDDVDDNNNNKNHLLTL